MADQIQIKPEKEGFSASELTALAHLYRGEMYRSKIWRTRLDTTTNWAVATTGLAVSVTFSNADNSPIPLILVAFLALVFLGIEARRYRYFDIWRTRVRILEICLYGPLLRGEGVTTQSGWNKVLADDYNRLGFHISFWEAVGRRLRRNYIWIFMMLALTYFAKLMIHPTAAQGFADIILRASIGPVSGLIVIFLFGLFFMSIFLFALVTLKQRQAAGRITDLDDHNEPFEKLGIQL